MRVMGFTHHPGALPFVTIRHDKWANRLVDLPQLIECKGEHGCLMGTVIAKVVRVEWFTGECPAHLAGVYKGQRLCQIWMEEP